MYRPPHRKVGHRFFLFSYEEGGETKPNDMLDYSYKAVFFAGGACIAILMTFLYAVISQEVNKPRCVESHIEKRWREGYTSSPYIASSNLALRMYKVHHPGEWKDVSVCDKYEEKTK